jgi:hypothetical protein
MLFQLNQQLQRQPAGMLHIVNHGTFPRPGLDQAEPALGSCTVYKSYLVSTGFSTSGTSNAVWLSSEL